MKDAEVIISVNENENNRLFELSHYSIVGDIYDIIPELTALIESLSEEQSYV